MQSSGVLLLDALPRFSQLLGRLYNGLDASRDCGTCDPKCVGCGADAGLIILIGARGVFSASRVPARMQALFSLRGVP